MNKQVARIYTGAGDSPQAQAMSKCDALGPLMLNIVKLYSTPDGRGFVAWGRSVNL
jgi:116 kDa U5 small nuclear ribonucleoprotein component